MTQGEALVRLQRMLAYDQEPTLTDSEVSALLSACRVADTSGLAPSDTSWTPTWDLNRGAAEGWRWKAGKVAGRFDFSTDGQSFHRSQMAEMCEPMVKQYARKVTSNVVLPGPLATEA